jgi:hypothetical protein
VLLKLLTGMDAMSPECLSHNPELAQDRLHFLTARGELAQCTRHWGWSGVPSGAIAGHAILFGNFESSAQRDDHSGPARHRLDSHPLPAGAAHRFEGKVELKCAREGRECAVQAPLPKSRASNDDHCGK